MISINKNLVSVFNDITFSRNFTYSGFEKVRMQSPKFLENRQYDLRLHLKTLKYYNLKK